MRFPTRRAAVVVAALLSLLACPDVRAQTPTYALVTYNQQARYFNQINDGARDAAAKVGVTLVIFNANNDPVAQANAIETYIQQKVQGIIVVPVNAHAIAPSVLAADAAGIPVVDIDAILPPGPQKARIGVDNEAAGQAIGTFFVNTVDQTMGGKARVGVVSALSSVLQNQRLKGFQDALVGHPGISIVQVVDGHNVQDTALTVAEGLVTGNPGLDAIYATGEPALIGAIAAVEGGELTDRVKIFGWDLSAQAIRGIDEGYVVGVVQQDPVGKGAAAVDALVKIGKGEAVPATVETPVTIVTRSNVDQYRAAFK